MIERSLVVIAFARAVEVFSEEIQQHVLENQQMTNSEEKQLRDNIVSAAICLRWAQSDNVGKWLNDACESYRVFLEKRDNE